MSKLPNVAIDGLAASGKTTVAKALSLRLGMVFLDTGMMYRAVTWKSLRDPTPLEELVKNIRMEVFPDPSGALVKVDGHDITSQLHSPEVSKKVSQVAAVSAVRRQLVALQQQMAQSGGIIMVGRDIATVVLPDAEVKIFLTCDLEERAHRRFLEMSVGNPNIGQDEVYADLKERDRIDTEREDSPLEQVPDARLVDTTGKTQDEVIEELAALIKPL